MKLEDVADIRSGNGFPKKYQGRTEGEFPFYKVGDISRHWQKGMITLTNGGHRLTQTEAKDLDTPLPPLPEQRRIVAEVEARTTAIDHLEAELDRQIARASWLRQGILASAFSGEGAFV